MQLVCTKVAITFPGVMFILGVIGGRWLLLWSFKYGVVSLNCYVNS